MNIRYSAMLVIFSLFMLVNISAQEATQKETLTVDQAVDYAIEGNLSLKQDSISLSAAERAKKYSWNSVSPSINATASLSKTLGSDNPTSISVGGAINIGLSPSLYTSIQSAKISYEQEKISYETAQRTIELNVRTAFYSLLYEKENIKLLNDNMTNAQRQYNQNLAKYNRGTLSSLDVLTAQVSYQSAQLSYESALITYQNDISSFKQTIGLDQTTEVELSGSLEDILNIGEISLDNVEQKSSTIESLEKQLELAENALLATRFSAWGPTITAGYSYTVTGNTDTGLKPQDDYLGMVSLGATIPLDGFLPWSTGAQSIATQKDTIEKLKLQIEDAKTTQELTVQTYMNQIKQTQSNITLRKSSVDLAKRTYDMTVDAYNHGTKDLLTLQTAANSMLSEQVNLMSDAYSLISTILKLEDAIGVPFGELIK